jgi:hypothetical protein
VFFSEPAPVFSATPHWLKGAIASLAKKRMGEHLFFGLGPRDHHGRYSSARVPLPPEFVASQHAVVVEYMTTPKFITRRSNGEPPLDELVRDLSQLLRPMTFQTENDAQEAILDSVLLHRALNCWSVCLNLCLLGNLHPHHQ